MVVIYTIPSSSYNPGMEPDPTLDEVEILGPPTTFASSSGSKTANFKLKVNGSTLNKVKARITMTRAQPITAGSQSPASNAVWTYIGTPTGGAYEAEWDLAATQVMAPSSHQEFAVNFSPGPAGLYRFTYSVWAEELSSVVETYQDVNVT